jgi:S-adenosylmethionine uptake transporter
MVVFAPWLAEMPGSEQAVPIFFAAALAFVSMLLLSWSYGRAEAQLLVPVEYTAFIWAAIIGWVFFGEPLTPETLIGTGLIVAGCLISARQQPVHIETTAV